MKTRTLAILTLLTSAAMHAHDFAVSERALRPANGVQEAPSVASSGFDSLAAWSDARSRVYDGTQPSPRAEWDVYGSRISVDGAPDPAGGVDLSPTYLQDESPSVIWNGSEYVVIDAVDGWPFSGRVSGMMFTRVTDNGPQAGTLVTLKSDALALYGARVVAAFNGSRYLVVIGYRWPGSSDYPSESTVIRAFLADSQFRMTSPLFDVSDASVDSILPGVTTDGTSFLITWLQVSGSRQEVHAAVVSPAGGVSRVADAIATTTASYDHWPPAAAWNGQQYLVTWSADATIVGRLMNANGSVAGAPFRIAHTDGIAVFAPSIAWNGSQFLSVFSYQNEWPTPTSYPVTNLYATRIRADGTLIDTPYPLTISTEPGEQTVSSVAASGQRFVVAYATEGEIRSVIVDPIAPAVNADALVTQSIAVQLDGRGAYNGDSFGFLWDEDADVLFDRMTIDGRPQDGAGIRLGSGTARTVLTNGDIFFAVWQPGPFVYPTGAPLQAARVSSRSQVLDDAPIDLPEGGDRFASDGRDFLVVTHQVFRNGTPYDRMRVAAYVVTSDAKVANAVAIAPAEFNQVAPSVAWNGSHYLLTYAQLLGEDCYHCFPKSESRAILLDRVGHPVDDPFLIGVSGLAAGGDGRFLVAGFQFQAPNSYDLVYTIIDDHGAATPLGRIKDVTPSRISDAAWTGTEFVIANGESLFHVSADGTLTGETPRAIPTDALEAQLLPARGAVPVLIRRIEKLAPGKHEGGIERYVLHWPDAGRARAVR